MMVFLVLLLCLLVGSILTAVVVQNSTLVVHLSVFMWQIPALPVGMLIVGAFLAGAFLLYVISVGGAWRDRHEIRRLRRRLVALEQSNSNYQVVSGPMPVMLHPARPQGAVAPVQQRMSR